VTKSDKVLVFLLRLVGVGSLFALIPVLMPMSWMVATHRWLGLGEMPTDPVVEYLARDLSAFYALLGALLLVMASDVERYRPLVRFFALAFILLSIVFTGVDLAAGMPWWWSASEGPGGVVFGALLLVMARPVHRAGALPDKATTKQPAFEGESCGEGQLR
jgi:hypothetical protein